jgi:hypothetical protein
MRERRFTGAKSAVQLPATQTQNNFLNKRFIDVASAVPIIVKRVNVINRIFIVHKLKFMLPLFTIKKFFLHFFRA